MEKDKKELIENTTKVLKLEGFDPENDMIKLFEFLCGK